MPKAYPLPSAEYLWSVLDYNPDTGLFRWKPRGKSRFDNRHAGNEALTARVVGYCVGHIHGHGGRVGAHRVAFKMVYGRDPAGEIDHINGDRADNRIANLRDVSRTINARNAARPRTNSSGLVGVSYRRDKHKWRAHITVDRQMLHLGYFNSCEAAIEARQAAERKYGFHLNHGRPLSL